jgi:hypothetical protein
MDPLTLSLLTSGVGLVGSLFQEDPNDKLRAFQKERQERLRRNLQEFETLKRRGIESNTRANVAGSKAATRSDLRRRGLEGTEIGQRRVNESSRAANAAFNQQISDLDLSVFRERQRIDGLEQPIVDQPSQGFNQLLGFGISSLLNNVGGNGLKGANAAQNLDQNNLLAQNIGLRAV